MVDNLIFVAIDVWIDGFVGWLAEVSDAELLFIDEYGLHGLVYCCCGFEGLLIPLSCFISIYHGCWINYKLEPYRIDSRKEEQIIYV